MKQFLDFHKQGIILLFTIENDYSSFCNMEYVFSLDGIKSDDINLKNYIIIGCFIADKSYKLTIILKSFYRNIIYINI